MPTASHLLRVLAASFLASIVLLAVPVVANAGWDTDIGTAGATTNVSSSTVGGVTTFTATSASAEVSLADIDAEFQAGNDVLIDASDPMGGEPGLITWDTAAFDDTDGGRLTLVPGAASRVETAGDVSAADIRVNGRLDVVGSIEATTGDVYVTGEFRLFGHGEIIANSDVVIDGSINYVSSAGTLEITAGSGVMVNGVSGIINLFVSAQSFDPRGAEVAVFTDIEINAPIVATGPVDFESAGLSSITTQSIDGPHPVSLDANTVTSASIGAATPVESLEITGSTYTLGGSSITATDGVSITNTQGIEYAVDTVVDAGSGDIELSDVDPAPGAQLDLRSSGHTNISDSPLSSIITTDAGGTTSIGGPVTCRGAVVHILDELTSTTCAFIDIDDLRIARATILGGLPEVTANTFQLGGPTIVSGLLAVNASAAATFSGALDIEALSTVGTTHVNLDNADLTTQGGSISDLVITGSNSIEATGAFDVDGSIDGPGSLELIGDGVPSIDVQQAVGAAIPLDSFTAVNVDVETSSLPTVVAADIDFDDVQFSFSGSSELRTVVATESIVANDLDENLNPVTLTAPEVTVSGARGGSATMRVDSADGRMDVTSVGGVGGVEVPAGAVLTWNTTAGPTNVELIDDGELRGTGTVGSITTSGAGGAVLAPGTASTPIGTLFMPAIVGGSDLTIRVDNGLAASDLLDVSGGVTLTGAALDVVSTADAPAGVARTIIANDAGDAVVGTFTGVAEGGLLTSSDGSLSQVSYAGGDGNDVTITRVLRPTTTSLAASSATSTAGAPVTLTATVESAFGTPSGSVAFMRGATLIGNAAVDGSGEAELTTSSLPAGTYSFTAEYDGTIAFDGSVSAGVSHTRTPAVTTIATTTTLTVAPASSEVGEVVTLTASVDAASGPAPGVGVVTFTRGSTRIGADVVDASGMARITNATMPAGTHSITAHYAGTSVFLASNSAARTHRRLGPMADPDLTISTSCIARGRPLPIIEFDSSRPARARITIQRRATPVPADARATCTTGSGGGSGGGGSTATFNTIGSVFRSPDPGRGHITTSLQALFGSRPIHPGVYRVTLLLTPKDGGPASTRYVGFTVAKG